MKMIMNSTLNPINSCLWIDEKITNIWLIIKCMFDGNVYVYDKKITKLVFSIEEIVLS